MGYMQTMSAIHKDNAGGWWNAAIVTDAGQGIPAWIADMDGPSWSLDVSRTILCAKIAEDKA